MHTPHNTIARDRSLGARILDAILGRSKLYSATVKARRLGDALTEAYEEAAEARQRIEYLNSTAGFLWMLRRHWLNLGRSEVEIVSDVVELAPCEWHELCSRYPGVATADPPAFVCGLSVKRQEVEL